MQFARFWAIYPNDPLRAALCMKMYKDEPPHISDAKFYAEHWVKDEEVISQRKIFAATPMDGVPNKEQFSTVLWEKLKRPMDNNEFTNMAKLFADVNGFMGKQEKAQLEEITQNHPDREKSIDSLLKKRKTRSI